MITIIAAITRDRALGRGGDMIYHISADLRRFKQLTMGHPIVMGRRTFESLPAGPLPGRRNIVVSKGSQGNDWFSSLQAALEAAGDEAMVIGGGQIYAQAMPLADKLEITEIDADAPDADTHFPVIGPEWLAAETGQWQTDPRSGVRFRHVTYLRRHDNPQKPSEK